MENADTIVLKNSETSGALVPIPNGNGSDYQKSTTIPQPYRALYDLEPAAMVAKATAMANVLADVIEKQKLFTMIQGKKYVRVDAWATLGSMMGIMPREVSVVEKENSDYEATVELFNIRTGTVVGRGSALCGVDEKRWGGADKYARRSMAITRATGKAYRLGFAWIMGLAGYEGTPAEEIPDSGMWASPAEKNESGKDAASRSRKSHDRSASRQEKVKEEKKPGYDPQNRQQQDWLMKQLELKNLPSDLWDKVGNALAGRPSTDLLAVIDDVLVEATGL